MVEYVQKGREVLVERRIARANGGEHVVREHVSFTHVLRASHADGLVAVTLHRPDLGTDEWDGRSESDDVEATILVDGEPAGTIAIASGEGAFDVSVSDGATHVVEVRVEGMDAAVLEVS